MLKAEENSTVASFIRSPGSETAYSERLDHGYDRVKKYHKEKHHEVERTVRPEIATIKTVPTAGKGCQA